MKHGQRGKYKWVAWTYEDHVALSPTQTLVYEQLAGDSQSAEIYLQEDMEGAIADEVNLTHVIDPTIRDLIASDWRSIHVSN
jgi:hypothetical protein